VEHVKVKISVLWIFIAVAMSAHYAMYVFEPGALQKILSGEMTLSPEFALVEVFTNWLIPLTMAFLSMTLGDLTNRRLNMILGGLFTLLGGVHLVTCPIVHILDNPSVHQLLLSVSMIVVAALIFCYAAKSKPKYESH
jgi:hypothetical protein